MNSDTKPTAERERREEIGIAEMRNASTHNDDNEVGRQRRRRRNGNDLKIRCLEWIQNSRDVAFGNGSSRETAVNCHIKWLFLGKGLFGFQWNLLNIQNLSSITYDDVILTI